MANPDTNPSRFSTIRRKAFSPAAIRVGTALVAAGGLASIGLGAYNWLETRNVDSAYQEELKRLHTDPTINPLARDKEESQVLNAEAADIEPRVTEYAIELAAGIITTGVAPAGTVITTDVIRESRGLTIILNEKPKAAI